MSGFFVFNFLPTGIGLRCAQHCIYTKQPACAIKLVDAGADIRRTNADMLDPLHAICRASSLPQDPVESSQFAYLVRKLLSLGMDPNHEVVRCGQSFSSLCPLLFCYSFLLQVVRGTCAAFFPFFSVRGKKAVLSPLPLSPTSFSRSRATLQPLFHACYNGHEKVALVLLEHGADPNTEEPESRMVFL